MAASLGFHQPEPFNVSGQCTNLCKQWEQYIKRFEYYMKAANITKEDQKRNLLLHVSGSQIQDIFDTLDNQGTTYQDALEALNNYFAPKKNIAYDRHVFRSAHQTEDESLDNFIVRLQKLAISCEFDTMKNDMIRDQVVEKCVSNELRKRLLQQKDLTLEKVQELGRTYELSKLQASKIQETNGNRQDQSQPEVNRLGRQPQTQNQDKTKWGFKPNTRRQTTATRQPLQQTRQNQRNRTAECYRCGQMGHYGKDCKKTKGIVLCVWWTRSLCKNVQNQTCEYGV